MYSYWNKLHRSIPRDTRYNLTMSGSLPPKPYQLGILILVISPLLLLFWFSLPITLFKKPLSSILLDQQGKLLGAHIATDQQWRFPTIKTVPKKFITCLIQFEDKRFYQHPGVDPLAIARALKLNLQQGRVVSGGSTLTMQVVRLSREKTQRSIIEKVIEMFMALRLETHIDKDEILKLYATHAPFGGNIVGLETASWRYFGRSPEQLSWAESAMLAVLPNSPALIHPGRHRLSLKKKRDALLLKLKTLHIIDPISYDLAITEPLPDSPKPLPRLASHLLDTLTPQSPHKRFITTLDKPLQQAINQIISAHANTLQLQSIHNIAALVIDNDSFKVKAYIGNSSTKQTGSEGYAIDLIHRPRSSGSTLKPFLFANMIEAGEIIPETLIPDVPIRYAGFRPQNYDRQYRGAVRAKQALARSLNIPAANMLSQYGVERFKSNLKNMGMTTLHRQASNYGLTLILGGAEGTLWEITSLYANLAKLANQGHQDSMSYWLKPTILANKPAKKTNRINLSSASAWMTLQALLEVTRPGTDGYWRKFSSTQRIAWKTGTSFGHRDAWAIGITPQYTVGVWAGNANGKGIHGLTGVKTAAPILFDIFNQLAQSRTLNSHTPHAEQKDWFSKPYWQMKTISICKDDGYLAVNHCDNEPYDIPVRSFYDKISPHHQQVHLDTTERWQVHSGCEPVSTMHHRSWFILPPDQAHYYQQHDAGYTPVPPFRHDCLSKNIQNSASLNNPISLIYPKSKTHIYIPTKLNGEPSKAVFRAIHRRSDSRLFWHIDQHYLGSTQTFHQQAVWVKPGKHRLTLVDENGNKKEQYFTVLEKTQ